MSTTNEEEERIDLRQAAEELQAPSHFIGQGLSCDPRDPDTEDRKLRALERMAKWSMNNEFTDR